jgi:hypothetical protein
MICKTLHRKLKINPHETPLHKKTKQKQKSKANSMNSGAPEGLAVP